MLQNPDVLYVDLVLVSVICLLFFLLTDCCLCLLKILYLNYMICLYSKYFNQKEFYEIKTAIYLEKPALLFLLYARVGQITLCLFSVCY